MVSTRLLVIVIVTLVCVTGVLILPQVDLPDFIVPPGRTATLGFAHLAISITLGLRSPIGKVSVALLRRNAHSGNVSRLVALDESDVQFVLSRLCTTVVSLP